MKTTPKEGDYVRTAGLTEAKHSTLINIFIDGGFLAGESARGYRANYFKCIGIINGKIHYSDCPDKYGRELSLSDLLGDDLPGEPIGAASGIGEAVTAWSGEGLPPAGTECSILWRGGAESKVKITYQGDGVGCYKSLSNGMEYTVSTTEVKFRPLKSEREIAIEEMWLGLSCDASHIDTAISICHQLYDAGYRRVEK